MYLRAGYPRGVHIQGVPQVVYIPGYTSLPCLPAYHGGYTLPCIYASLYTPGVHPACPRSQVYPLYCTEQQTVRDDEALGSKRENPLGRETTRRIEPSFL